jgi:hypothetical protein
VPDWSPDRRVQTYKRRRLFVGNAKQGVFFHMGIQTGKVGSALDITHRWYTNWFHFLLEVCGVFANPQLADVPAQTPILFNRDATLPTQVEALRFFAGDRVARLTPAGAMGRVACGSLWHLDGAWHNSPYRTAAHLGDDFAGDTTCHHHRSHLRNPDVVADFFRRACPSERPRGERIFLSRKNAKRARCVNEAELEAEAMAQGFISICPEDMSFAEQVAAFYHADVVAGVSGAAFANLVFCREGTRVVCVRDEHSDSVTFAQLAAGLGLSLEYLDGVTQSHSVDIDFATFRLDAADFARKLRA